MPAVKYGLLIPSIGDDQLVNRYHVPVYRDLPGNYSWGPINYGNTQIATGGAEKECFTVQLSCLKSGRKLRPIIIFKGAPAHAFSSTRSIVVEIRDMLPDNAGNMYPSRNKIHIITKKTANLTGGVTMDCLRDVIFHEIGVLEGERCGVLVDDFKGHSKLVLK